MDNKNTHLSSVGNQKEKTGLKAYSRRNLVRSRNPPPLAVVMSSWLCLLDLESKELLVKQSILQRKFAMAKPHIGRKAAAYGGG